MDRIVSTLSFLVDHFTSTDGRSPFSPPSVAESESLITRGRGTGDRLCCDRSPDKRRSAYTISFRRSVFGFPPKVSSHPDHCLASLNSPRVDGIDSAYYYHLLSPLSDTGASLLVNYVLDSWAASLFSLSRDVFLSVIAHSRHDRRRPRWLTSLVGDRL